MDEFLRDIESRWQSWNVTAVAESVSPLWLVGVGLLLGLILAINPAYLLTRHVVTFTHEGGHAVVGLLTGRKLAGIHLHTDSSGATITAGRPGVGRVLTAAAGYPAPAVVAGLLMAAVLTDTSAFAITIGAALTAILLAFTRNLWGFIVTLFVLVGFIVVLRWLPIGLIPLVTSAAVSLLAVGALRDLLVERRARRVAITDVKSISLDTNAPGWFVWFVLAGISIAGLVLPTLMVLW